MITGYIKGDLVTLFNEGKNIAHGCNCFCTMGAGVAKSLADNFMEIKEADRMFAHCVPLHNRLGDFSTAYALFDENVCYNMYTQYYPGRNVDYGAIFNSFKKLAESGVKGPIYIPRIGAGIAGGDWDLISMLIDKASGEMRVVVVDWVPSAQNSLFEGVL